LFVYTPATHNTLDLGRPVSASNQIAALVLGADGVVYGGTTSYQQGQLFAFNPATRVITDIVLPVTTTYQIDALTTADGRIYAGVGAQLVVYDPVTRDAHVLGAPQSCAFHTLAAGPDGRIYAGCSNQLLAYDPIKDEVTVVGKTPVAEIRSLAIGLGGRIYGSFFHEYTGRTIWYDSSVFVYDPRADRMLDLGMASTTGPVVLAACRDGAIYGGSNTTNSNYRGPAYLFAFRSDCPTGPVGTWDRITWEADTPPGTDLTVDVLNGYGVTTLVRNIENGGSLQAINPISNTAITLRANLSTTDPRVTPILKNWRVDYTFACNSQPDSGQP